MYLSENHIIFDLEATCWDVRSNSCSALDAFKQRNEMEIIEIGAVKVDKNSYDLLDTFQCFVRPLVNTQLSDFCKNLTTITQDQVDNGLSFIEAYTLFLEWCSHPEFYLSWGADYEFISKQAISNGLSPLPYNRCINAKTMYSDLTGRKAKGLKKAINHYGLSFQGTQHRAADDAFMTSQVIKKAREEYKNQKIQSLSYSMAAYKKQLKPS